MRLLPAPGSPPRLLVVALLLALCSLLSGTSQASSCPAFANEKLSCGPNTCGKYVFRGSFKAAPAASEGQLASSKGQLAKARVPAVRDGVRLGKTAQPADCCRQCRQHKDCAYWNYFSRTGLCLLYTSDLCLSTEGAPEAEVYSPGEPHSFVGGRCNAKPYADQYYAPLLPHTKQQGAQHPLPPVSFCLVSDPQLHINMMLSGYLDDRSEVTAPVTGQHTAAEAKVRTWIREIGLLWIQHGKQHSVKFVARRGVEQERGEGYMGSIEIDGVRAPRLTLGDELNLFDGQGSVLFDSYEKVGPYDVDLYVIKVDGVLEAELRVRAAHPLLQEANDSEVHFNLDVVDVAYTANVHGVLGQAYREEGNEKTLNYGTLASLINSKEGSSVENLEGHVEDYRSSSTLLPDCKFSRFEYSREIGGDANLLGIGGMAASSQKARFLSISLSEHDL